MNDIHSQVYTSERLLKTKGFLSVEVLADTFMKNPLGLPVGDDFYVRSPQQVKDGKIVFYYAIKQGMELDILEGTDIVTDTGNALKATQKELGEISTLINVNSDIYHAGLYVPSQEKYITGL